MTIGDLAHLGSPGGAQRTQAPQIARGRVVRAPASVTDSMVVALDRYALAFPYEVLSGRWPAGGRLPQSGDVCLVIFDDAGDAWVRGGAWQAETLVGIDGSGVSSALQLLTPQRLQTQIGSTSLTWAGTSADGNATVAHGLGRTPVLVWAPNLVIPATRSWQCFAGAYTSTNFALLARPDGVYTGTVSFPWAVIG